MRHLLMRLKVWWHYRKHPDSERISPAMRACMAKANLIAQEWGSKYIESPHIVCGILKTSCLAHMLDIDTEAVIADMRASLSSRKTGEPEKGTDLMISAVVIARELDTREISPTILLAGILREPTCIASVVLKRHGITDAIAKEYASKQAKNTPDD